MRRKAGICGIKTRQRQKHVIQEKGDGMQATEDMQKPMVTFKVDKDAMCTKIGDFNYEGTARDPQATDADPDQAQEAGERHLGGYQVRHLQGEVSQKRLPRIKVTSRETIKSVSVELTRDHTFIPSHCQFPLYLIIDSSLHIRASRTANRYSVGSVAV